MVGVGKKKKKKKMAHGSSKLIWCRECPGKNIRVGLLSLENPMIPTKGLCWLHSGFLPAFLFWRARTKKISQEWTVHSKGCIFSTYQQSLNFIVSNIITGKDNRERNCLCSLSQSAPQEDGMNKHLGTKKRQLMRNMGAKEWSSCREAG